MGRFMFVSKYIFLVLDVDCTGRSRFIDTLYFYNLAQIVRSESDAYSRLHSREVLVSSCDSELVCDVSVGDFLSYHTIIRCHQEFSYPATISNLQVSYRWCHKIDMDQFYNDLKNVLFLLSLEGTTASVWYN